MTENVFLATIGWIFHHPYILYNVGSAPLHAYSESHTCSQTQAKVLINFLCLQPERSKAS